MIIKHDALFNAAVLVSARKAPEMAELFVVGDGRRCCAVVSLPPMTLPRWLAGACPSRLSRPVSLLLLWETIACRLDKWLMVALSLRWYQEVVGWRRPRWTHHLSVVRHISCLPAVSIAPQAAMLIMYLPLPRYLLLSTATNASCWRW